MVYLRQFLLTAFGVHRYRDRYCNRKGSKKSDLDPDPDSDSDEEDSNEYTHLPFGRCLKTLWNIVKLPEARILTKN